jgi:hypothetical protein
MPIVTRSILFLPSQFPKVTRHLSEIWPNTVALYSRGNLAYPTHRLVAISGVAKWFEAQIKDDYLAGMWRRDLVRQLCWYITQDKGDYSSFARPKAYIAPSWSWASLTSPVNYADDFCWKSRAAKMQANTRVCVLSAQTVLEDENYRFEKVKSGVLRLVLERLFFGTAEMNGPSGISGDVVCPHGWVLLGETQIHWDCPEEPKNKIYVLTVIFLPDISEISEVGTAKHGKGYGIILEATDESRRAEYRRVGYYESWHVDWFHLNGSEDDESFYEEVEESGQKLRAISIV